MTSEIIIADFIHPVLDEILPPIACGPNRPQVLYGTGGALDSIGLLSLVVLLEEKVNAATGKTIRLVSNEAFSQTRSPFRDVTSLAEYVVGLLAC